MEAHNRRCGPNSSTRRRLWRLPKGAAPVLLTSEWVVPVRQRPPQRAPVGMFVAVRPRRAAANAPSLPVAGRQRVPLPRPAFRMPSRGAPSSTPLDCSALPTPGFRPAYSPALRRLPASRHAVARCQSEPLAPCPLEWYRPRRRGPRFALTSGEIGSIVNPRIPSQYAEALGVFWRRRAMKIRVASNFKRVAAIRIGSFAPAVRPGRSLVALIAALARLSTAGVITSDPACSDTTAYTAYVVDGFTCTVGQLTFSNFTLGAGSNLTADQITVTQVANGLQFAFPLTTTSMNVSQLALNIGFDVQIGEPGLGSAGLSFVGTGTDPGVTANVTENVAGGPLEVFQKTPTVNDTMTQNNVLVGLPNTMMLTVTESATVSTIATGAPRTASISSMTDTFIPAPEPGTLALAGLGALGLAWRIVMSTLSILTCQPRRV